VAVDTFARFATSSRFIERFQLKLIIAHPVAAHAAGWLVAILAWNLTKSEPNSLEFHLHTA
jgi:hypothetical protein